MHNVIIFVFLLLIVMPIVLLVINRLFFTSFHDKCYEEMEGRGYAIFGMCSGKIGNHHEYDCSCIDCPYFNISFKKGKKNGKTKSKSKQI